MTPLIHPSKPRIFALNPGPVREVTEAPAECRYLRTLRETGEKPIVLCYSVDYTTDQVNIARRLSMMTAADWSAEAREQARIAHVARSEAEEASGLWSDANPPPPLEPGRAFQAATLSRQAATAARAAADTCARLPGRTWTSSGLDEFTLAAHGAVTRRTPHPDASNARGSAIAAEVDADAAWRGPARWDDARLDALAVGGPGERHPRAAVRRAAARAGCAVKAYVARRHEAPTKILRELDRAIRAYERAAARHDGAP